jgi:serine/threonine-protein kinase ULK/ATG1
MSASGARSEYQRLERIGRGSFATVYRAVHLASNREVAIKDISQEKLTHKLQENLESEISILKNHSHRNIVKLYAIEVRAAEEQVKEANAHAPRPTFPQRNERHIYIILEYCRGGDLQRFIKAQPAPSRLDEATARHFMRHLAAGLKFLNDRNLVRKVMRSGACLGIRTYEELALVLACRYIETSNPRTFF